MRFPVPGRHAADRIETPDADHSATTTTIDRRPGPGGLPGLPGLRWWRELLAVGGFYLIYSFTRSIQGHASTARNARSLAEAQHHAVRVIQVEHWLHIFREQTIQAWFIGWRVFIEFWNLYYGSVHFIVTIGVLVWLFVRHPDAYRRWRWVLAVTTALALIGFLTWPLAPPRLLPAHYGFVDTIDKFPTLWTFDSGPVSKVSNQFAAMPSLHFAWSSWCVCAVLSQVKKPWARIAWISYPFVTLFAIVVTANHYFLDAVGGAVVFAIGLPVGTIISRRLNDWHLHRQADVDDLDLPPTRPRPRAGVASPIVTSGFGHRGRR